MKVRTIDPEQKIGRVVVARSLFVEKDCHKVSLPLIVAASGVSTGTIYKHFVKKEGRDKA